MHELDRGAAVGVAARPRTRAGAVGAVVELDALAQRAAAPPGVGTPSTSARYSFSHAVARVREQLRELAVVGEQQQPLGVVVEPADREHARLGRHELDDRRPALRVAARCVTTPAGLLSR